MNRKFNDKKMEQAVKLFLEAIGSENLERDGLLETPKRVAKAWKDLMLGYSNKNEKILEKSFDDIEVGSTATVKISNIPIYSFCEHHLLPFFGTACVKYKPNKKIVGLSKINRLVQNICRKLQTQERITHEIVMAFKKHLDVLECEVQLDCRHMCIEMRGIEHRESTTTTEEFYIKG